MLFFSPIKRKSSDIQKKLKAEIEHLGVPVLHVTAFGFKFDSAFWIAVKTDAERDRLLADDALLKRLHDIIEASGYLKLIHQKWEDYLRSLSMEHLLQMGITFESQETVDRDFNGNWFHALK